MAAFSHHPFAHSVAVIAVLIARISCHGTALGKDPTMVAPAEPGRTLYEGEPEMDIGWQLPYAPQRDTETVCQGFQSQDGMRLVI